MKKFRKQAITCTGDDYKVKQLRLALEGMDLSKHPDDWGIAQVRSSYMKGINLDKGAINLLIDYYTNTYDPKKDEFSSDYVASACNKRKAVKANNRPASRRRAIKANLYGDAYEDIELGRDAYIQQWQNEYEGEPSTGWDNIFDQVLDDFVLYCGDEASADETGKTIEEKYESGEYTSADVEDEFDSWIMWISLDDYDYE